jgi:hypothetical protein
LIINKLNFSCRPVAGIHGCLLRGTAIQSTDIRLGSNNVNTKHDALGQKLYVARTASAAPHFLQKALYGHFASQPCFP